ncbi:hypothetical protein FNV58_01330 (plasmid) [Streptomyces sp. RLB1-9]|uniref:hypothetical protein n=1 Tax=Streptomyces sp. RLB1-9 TaxID=2594454 RepID=UPI001163595A|nr:hypothetical protein [Streptomyces sp. RLB1-9]QDN95004.1 hypothetical protein FNV58_01330 [Streptomyces sp. RLB1-9]
MAQTESPENVGQLWRLIERELTDVKSRLDSYVTKDQFDAERRLLEARISTAEDQLKALKREVSDDRSSRHQSRREFVYKGIIPVLALAIAAVSLLSAFR